MNDLTTTTTQLPSNIPELSKFVLVGRDKLKAVRAEIHAIDKVGLAQEVREQKLHEAQEIAEVVTDAECRLGELLKEIPKNNVGRPTKNIVPQFDNLPNKSEVIKESGISQKQAEHFQIMASHPESVARAKERARQEGEVLSRSAVIEQVNRDYPKPKTARQEAEEARERHAEFQKAKEDGETVISLQDMRSDAYDVKTIGRDFYSQILSATQKVYGLSLFKTQSDIDAVVKTIGLRDRQRLGEGIDDCIEILQFFKRKISEVK